MSTLYITDRKFRMKQENYFDLKEVEVESVVGSILYLVYTRHILHITQVTVATFADDIALLATNSNIVKSTNLIPASQPLTNQLLELIQLCKTKLNEANSIHINFSRRKL